MRRVVLLALLALALPLAASATTVDYAGFAGASNAATLSGNVATADSFTLSFNTVSIDGGAFGPDDLSREDPV